MLPATAPLLTSLVVRPVVAVVPVFKPLRVPLVCPVTVTKRVGPSPVVSGPVPVLVVRVVRLVVSAVA